MAIRTVNSCCGNDGALVEHFIGTAYDVVKTVYDNLGILQYIYDFLNQHGVLVTVDSVDELKALNTDMKYARVYTYSATAGYGYTDYLYVEGNDTGVIPNDPDATGTWVVVASSSTGGGEGGNAPAYIPYVYAQGSALGGETTIAVPNGTVGVPFIIVEGYMNTVGYGFTFDTATLTVTLAQPLEVGDEVVLLLTGTPAVPDNPNISNWVTINWLYNGGYAVGGEQVIAIPYTFEAIPAIYKNGERYYAGLADKSYTVDAANQRILLTEPLATNDRLIVQIGGESTTFIMSDRTVQEVARSANVHENEVILSTNTTQYLNGMKVVYDVVAQKIYGLPTLPTNVYINSVSNGELTYSPGNITVDLVPVPGSAEELEATLASTNGASSIGTSTGSTVEDELGPYAATGATNKFSKEDHANRQIYSDDFGIPGTDSGNSVNLAFDYLKTVGDAFAHGGKVNIPRGFRIVDTAINLNRYTGSDVTDNLTLCGEGAGTSELRAGAALTTANEPIIRVGSPGGLAIQQYHLDSFSTRGGYNGVRVETASRGNIHRLKVENSTNDGIYIGNSWVNVYSGILVNNAGANGVNFDPSVNKQKTSTAVTSGYVNTAVGAGWVWGFMNYSAATAVAADACGSYGHHIKNSEAFVMTACGNESAQRSGIFAEASSAIGTNRSILIQGHFSHNSNLSNGGWANLLHAKSLNGVDNRITIRDSTSHAPNFGTPDIIADGVGTIIVNDNNITPNGVRTYNGGYIDHVHHPLLINNKNVPASTATVICKLGSTQGHTTNLAADTSCFAGEVTIVASTSAPSTAVRRIAVYKLLVCVTAEQGKECFLVKSLGYISGNVAGAPSFTWSIDSNNQLVATPIGSAAGNFWFEVTTDSQVKAAP